MRKALHACGVLPFAEVADKRPEDCVGTYYMPVAGPFSVHGVHDFVGCWHGRFFSIETKAPDNPEDETIHQGKFRVAVERTGGIAVTGARGPEAVYAIRDMLAQTL